MSEHEQILIKMLNKIAAEQKIDNAQVNIKPITSGGANFTSQLFQATIGNGYTVLKVFAKVAAIGEKLREHMSMLLFDMENLFYTRLYHVYESLQEKYNVPQDKRFVAPKCYGCSNKMYEEVIVLEDLSAQGFTVHDRMKSVYWNYAAKAIDQIARFHALSIAFEKEHKEEFDNILKRYNIQLVPLELIRDSITNAIKVVKEEYKDKLRKFFESPEPLDMSEFYKPLRLNVLTHGDNRISNHMHRKDAVSTRSLSEPLLTPPYANLWGSISDDVPIL